MYMGFLFLSYFRQSNPSYNYITLSYACLILKRLTAVGPIFSYCFIFYLRLNVVKLSTGAITIYESYSRC